MKDPVGPRIINGTYRDVGAKIKTSTSISEHIVLHTLRFNAGEQVFWACGPFIKEALQRQWLYKRDER